MPISNDELHWLVNLGIVVIILLIIYLAMATVQIVIQILSPKANNVQNKVVVMEEHKEPEVKPVVSPQDKKLEPKATEEILPRTTLGLKVSEGLFGSKHKPKSKKEKTPEDIIPFS